MKMEPVFWFGACATAGVAGGCAGAATGSAWAGLAVSIGLLAIGLFIQAKEGSE